MLAQPIATFLDAADMVLNSNTFLLQFDINSDNIAEELLSFLNSKMFIEQLAQQDLERGWYMYHDIDRDTWIDYHLKKGTPVKEDTALEIVNSSHPRAYLIAMLTGNTQLGRFLSYYSKQLDLEKASTIVDGLISFLCKDAAWDLFVVEPNFLKVVDDTYEGEDLRYFESYGNNNAAIIKCKNQGFLLLTNGID